MRALLARLLLLLPLLAAAEDTATVRITPQQLNPGEPFRMEIVIDSTDDFPGPALRIASELPVVDDIPLRFAGQRINANNQTTLLVSGVAPESPGDYTIPGFTATLAVRKVAVPPARLSVRRAPAGATAGFARFSLEMADRTYYVGETLRATVVLTPGANERIAGLYGVEGRGEGLVCRNAGQGSRNTEGPLRAELDVTPTQAGTLDLRISGMALLESTTGTSSRDRPFAFGRKVRVAHVPERDRPADWAGAVGSLSAGPVTLSNPAPGIGEPTTLSLTLRGKGNLDRVLPPEVPHGDAWDVQPVNLPTRGFRASEQRVFTYTLIPRLPGKLRTPAVHLSAFNPESGKYERIEFPSLDVEVSGQAPAQVDLIAPNPAGAEASPGARDPVHTTELAEPMTGGRAVATQPILSRPSTLAWTQLAGLLLVGLGLAWAARRDWLARHPEIVRRRAGRAALRAARRRLRRASARRDGEVHAQAAVEALRAGAAALVAASDRALTAEDILRIAPTLPHAEAVRAAFRRADGTRFGGQPADDTLALHAELERCLAQLESQLCA